MTDNAADKFWRETIYNDILKLSKGLEQHPWSRRQTMTDSHAIAHTVKILNQIANDLYLARQSLKERAQRAEAEAQEAVAREAIVYRFAQQFSDGVFEMLRPCAGNTNIAVWKTYHDETLALPQAATALLERLAELEDEITSLRAAIEEVAIPSLLYCEKMYDHDDMARLNLEAALQLRER